ncbi:MAG: hypothetical protein OCD76_16995 [Reichenbachiella sp.]
MNFKLLIATAVLSLSLSVQAEEKTQTVKVDVTKEVPVTEQSSGAEKSTPVVEAVKKQSAEPVTQPEKTQVVDVDKQSEKPVHKVTEPVQQVVEPVQENSPAIAEVKKVAVVPTMSQKPDVKKQEVLSEVWGGVINAFTYDFESKETSFTTDQVLLGYKNVFANGIEGGLVLEVLPEEAGKQKVYLKEGYFIYNDFFRNTSIQGGLMPTMGYQEAMAFYAYDYYIYPVPVTFIEQPETDLGFKLSREFSDNGVWALGVYSSQGYQGLGDLSEGYNLLYAAEVALDFDILTLNVNADIKPFNGRDSIVVETGSYEPELQYTANLFAGLDVQMYRGGLEYSYRGNDNGSSEDINQIHAFAAYGVIPVSPLKNLIDIELFARYDLELRGASDKGSNRLTSGIQSKPYEEIIVTLKYDLHSYDAKRDDETRQTFALLTSILF